MSVQSQSQLDDKHLGMEQPTSVLAYNGRLGDIGLKKTERLNETYII